MSGTRRSGWALLGTALVVSVLIGCGADKPGISSSTEGPPSTSSTTSADDQAALQWSKYVATMGGAVWLETTETESADGPVRLVALVKEEHRSVVVANFDGERWRTLAEVALLPPDFAFSRNGEVEIADITGDGRDDFLVPMEAAQPIGVVVSDDGGFWRLLAVDDESVAAGGPYVGINPRFENGNLVSDERTCEPSCAEGETRALVWSYVDGVLRPTD